MRREVSDRRGAATCDRAFPAERIGLELGMVVGFDFVADEAGDHGDISFVPFLPVHEPCMVRCRANRQLWKTTIMPRMKDGPDIARIAAPLRRSCPRQHAGCARRRPLPYGH